MTEVAVKGKKEDKTRKRRKFVCDLNMTLCIIYDMERTCVEATTRPPVQSPAPPCDSLREIILGKQINESGPPSCVVSLFFSQ